jgi:DNA polymerase III sliding clamp (beta) subunit (PCNA family)
MLKPFLSEACQHVIALATATATRKPQLHLQSDGTRLHGSLEAGGASVYVAQAWSGDTFALTLDPFILQEVVEAEAEVKRLSLEDNTLVLGATRLNIDLSKPHAFPRQREGVFVSSTVLREALAATKHALAKTPRHAYDSLLLFDFTNGELVATDSFRLALQILPNLGVAPFKLSREYAAMLEQLPEGEVVLALEGEHVHFRSEGYALTLPLDHTGFPNYRRILPTEGACGTEVEVHAKELQEVVARVGLFAEQRCVELTFAEQELTITARDTYGQSHQTLPVAQRGEAVKLKLHKEYLEEALASASGVVRWRIGSPNEASVFELNGGLRLLVPLKV